MESVIDQTHDQAQVAPLPTALAPAPLKEWPALVVGSTVYLPVDEINIDHEANSRKYAAGKIAGMAESLLDKGQIQPVKITSTTRRLAAGYRRSASVAYINENGLYKSKDHPNFQPNMHGRTALVRCEVIPELSERDLYLMNMAENGDREDDTPIDRANQMKRLTAPEDSGGFGMTQKEAAAEMSHTKAVTQSTISKYLKVLAEAPAWAIKLVHEGKRPMENLIEAVGFPAGSAERDTALASFKAGESGTTAKAKVREAAGDGGESEGEDTGESAGGKKKGKTVRSRAELVAAYETLAFVEEGSTPTPFEEIFQAHLKFAAGKMSAKKFEEFVALRVKKSLPKAE